MTENVNPKPAPEAAIGADGETLLTQEPQEPQPQPQEPQPQPQEPDYTDFNLPENLNIRPETMDRFKALATEHNLTQEAAQKFVDLAVENGDFTFKQQKDLWDQTRKQWVDEITNDPQLGGPKLGETRMRAQRVLVNHGDPELIEFLDKSGFGDNASLIRMLANLDRALGEDRFEAGPAAMGTPEESLADRMFPNHPKHE